LWLFYFLKSVKASATILIVIPVTLCATGSYILRDKPFNMTLGAIAAAVGLLLMRYWLWSKSIEPMRSILKNHDSISTKSNSLSLSSNGRFVFIIVIFLPLH
jgi:hypothetical protein